MSNVVSEIKAIHKFLEVYKDDNSLRRFFLRKFDGSNELSWKDSETSYKVDFLFVDDDNSRKFWIDNIINYSYLYVYAVLSKWKEEYDDDIILKERCENFLDKDKFYSKIEENIEHFKKNYGVIQPTIDTEIRIIIDNYLKNKATTATARTGKSIQIDHVEEVPEKVRTNTSENADAEVIYKVVSSIATACEKGALKGVSYEHCKATIDDCNNIRVENNYPASLNRIIMHLSTAYSTYSNSIWSIKMGGAKKKSLWRQYKKINFLCLALANIYHIQGNQNMVNYWLLDKMSSKGPWRSLGIEVFSYNELLGNNYKIFEERIIIPSDKVYDDIENYEEAKREHWEEVGKYYY